MGRAPRKHVPAASSFRSNDSAAPQSKAVTSLENTRLCKYYMNGNCDRGASCTFAHGAPSLKPQPDLFRTQFCHRFRRTGACPRGDMCNFAHGEQELRTSAPAAATRAAKPTRVSMEPKDRALTRRLLKEVDQLRAQLAACTPSDYARGPPPFPTRKWSFKRSPCDLASTTEATSSEGWISRAHSDGQHRPSEASEAEEELVFAPCSAKQAPLIQVTALVTQPANESPEFDGDWSSITEENVREREVSYHSRGETFGYGNAADDAEVCCAHRAAFSDMVEREEALAVAPISDLGLSEQAYRVPASSHPFLDSWPREDDEEEEEMDTQLVVRGTFLTLEFANGGSCSNFMLRSASEPMSWSAY